MVREAYDGSPGGLNSDRAAAANSGPIARLKARIVAHFAPRGIVPGDLELAAGVLTDQFLASFPILAIVLVLRLALGTGMAETANLALAALIGVNSLAVLFFRAGRVYISGGILTLALWAAGTFMIWTHPAVLGELVIVLLFPAIIAFLVLPWRSSLVVAALSATSIAVLALRAPDRGAAASRTDQLLALAGSLVAIANLTLVVRASLHRAIRQRRAAQEALSRSEGHLSSILQKTPDLIYRLDTEGRITFINDAVRRYGYDPSEMIGTPVFDYVHPADREIARMRFAQWRSGGAPERTREVRLVSPTAGERVAEYTAAPVVQEPVFLLLTDALYDRSSGSERFAGIQGIARDISDRRHAEEALRLSEEKYSKVFHTTPAGIAVSSLKEGRFLDVNAAFERMIGYRRGELVGRTSFDTDLWVDPQERAHIVDLLERGEPAEDLEIHLRAKDGGFRTLRLGGQLIEIGGVRCVLSTMEDITDRKRLEVQLQQSQKLEAVGRLAGGIAHDFNNLLTVILGRAEMASASLTPENPLFEDIHEIQKAAERSSEMTRELLMFARKQDVAPRPLDLNQAISERLGILRRLIGENIALEWQPAPGLWPVRMDPVQIDRILVNLSVNARDAIGDVGTLTIATENRLQAGTARRPEPSGGPGEWVVLSVSDTGSGMSQDTLAHLFEPFFTTKEIGKGTGLGLATVYGTVEHSGGWIEVQSDLGKGTTFRVYLPRAQGAQVQTDEAGEERLERGQETVLVVEDDLAILKVVRAVLQRQGYTVIEATSAEDALLLAASRERPLHLLLTDVVMPRMNGRDLHERVAALHPGIKAILMSGYSAGALQRSDGGREDIPFLPKPFSMKQLSSKVREVLDGKTSEARRSDPWYTTPVTP